MKFRARVPFADFLEGTVTDPASPRRDEARKIATFLLRAHVERYLTSRGLRRYETSSGAAFYFPSGLLPGDKVPYLAASGRRTNKNVAGRSERNKVNWHLAMKVNVVIGPPSYVRFKPYVCFSEDGQTAISDPKRTSAIRRRFCRSWWNPQWRQLQEAFCAFLASENGEVTIDLAGPEKLVLSGELLELVAARTMPDDLKVAEEQDEPEELTDPEDDDEDETLGPEDGDIAEDVE